MGAVRRMGEDDGKGGRQGGEAGYGDGGDKGCRGGVGPQVRGMARHNTHFEISYPPPPTARHGTRFEIP